MNRENIGAFLPRRTGFFAGLAGAAALGLCLAGCASSRLDDLGSAEPTGSAFDQALFRNYETLARSFGGTSENGGADFFDDPLSYLGITSSDEESPSEMLAEAFAGKALIAASGRDVAPEAGADATSQMMRSRLVGMVGAGKDRFPEDAARAQADYDCWMLNAAVAAQASSAAQCRTSFNASLGQLEAELNPAPVAAPLPPAPTPPATAITASTTDFTVYFDFDSWTLSAEDLTVLTNVINTARAGRQTHITVVGHTDTSGAAGYNQSLSAHRANVVVEALVDMGARRAAIQASGVGESDLAVKTADGVREPKNRRAVIDLLP